LYLFKNKKQGGKMCPENLKDGDRTTLEKLGATGWENQGPWNDGMGKNERVLSLKKDGQTILFHLGTGRIYFQ